jgi:hypothetical protein
MQCSSPPSQLIDKEHLIIVTLIVDAHNRSSTTGTGRKRGRGLYTHPQQMKILQFLLMKISNNIS